MKRFFAAMFSCVSLTTFAALVGWPPFSGVNQSVAFCAVISILGGVAFSAIFYELDQYSGKGLSGCISSNPMRRWFWWGVVTGLVDSILILGTVLISAFAIKQVPEWADGFGMILATIGILSFALFPAATLVAIRSKLMAKQ